MGRDTGTLEHTADLGLWVEAESPAGLMESAAVAVAELMYTGPREGEITWLEYTNEGSDRAELLVGLLSEVVYLADAERRLVAACQVREATAQRLLARLGVVPLTAGHRPREPVKAVTYHRAQVRQDGPDRWRGEVYLDV
jgi:SHS2 domain-containing protein